MEILKHNCIDSSEELHEINQNNPDEKPYIKVFYTSADDIIIAGMIADRGVYWLSVTDAKDESTIRAVFDHVSGIEPKKYADIHSVIAGTYYTEEHTFDFPQFSENVQTRIHFLYGDSEKAYKTCHSLVRKAYPSARMTAFKGYAHLTYSAKRTEKYISLIKKEIGS